MKPIILTPSKAASLVDAYRQFRENPDLEDRINGLSRLECYRLFHAVRVFYGQRDEALTISFIERIADGKVVLSGEVFGQQPHDEKLTQEYNSLEGQIFEQPAQRRVLFRSAPLGHTAGEEISEASTEQKTVVDEIRTWVEKKAKQRAQEYLRKQGLSEERVEVYSSVGATRVGELGPDKRQGRGLVQELVRGLVPELNETQAGEFLEDLLSASSSDAGDSPGGIGTTLSSLKYAAPAPRQPRSYTINIPQGTAAAQEGEQKAKTGTSEQWKKILTRLEHQPLSPWRRFFNDVVGQIAPGFRRNINAKALEALEQARQKFLERNPQYKIIAEALGQAYKHYEVLRQVDPTKPLRFTVPGELLDPDQMSPGMRTPHVLEFDIERLGGESAGRVEFRKEEPSAARRGRLFNEVRNRATNELRTQATRYATQTGKRLAANAGRKVFGGMARGLVGAGGRAAAGLSTTVLPAIASFIAGIGTSGGGFLVVIAVVVGAVIALVFLLSAMSNNSALRVYVSEGTPSTVVQSEYIDVTAQVNPNSYKEDLPVVVEFTIVVTAKKKNLENVKISEAFSVYAKEGNPSLPSVETHTLPVEMAEGKSETISYNLKLDPLLKDSIITNTITVSADVKDGPYDEKTITSVSVLLGEVPTGCFAFEGGWSDGDRALELQAIGTLSRSSAFMGKLCKDNTPIRLVRSYENTGYGGYVPGDGQVIIYSLGLMDSSNTLYTLAHESGHILDQRQIDLLRNFPVSIAGESFLPTYPYGDKLSEDFAETVADFVVWKSKTFYTKGTRLPYKLNMEKDFPKHYGFALYNIFDGFVY